MGWRPTMLPVTTGALRTRKMGTHSMKWTIPQITPHTTANRALSGDRSINRSRLTGRQSGIIRALRPQVVGAQRGVPRHDALLLCARRAEAGPGAPAVEVQALAVEAVDLLAGDHIQERDLVDQVLPTEADDRDPA